MEKTTFKKGQPSPGLNTFLRYMEYYGYEFLTKVIIFTASKQVCLLCEGLFVFLPCEIGKNGAIEFGLSAENDQKTPVCETRVRHIDLPIQAINNPSAATMSKTREPQSNFGPCFICLYITVPGTEKVRGIGLHGCDDDSNGILRPTDGCIRLFNADLLLIRKLFFKNLQVQII